MRRLRRPTGALWSNPDFIKLWAGQSISELGSQFSQLAIPIVAAIALHASPIVFSLLAVFGFLPFILFALPAGAGVDRMRRRVIDLQSGRIIRDEDDGLYRQADQNTAEFGAMLRGDDGMPLQRRGKTARQRSAEELFDEAFGDDK